MLFSMILAAVVLFLLLFGVIETAVIYFVVAAFIITGILLHTDHGHHHGGFLSIDLYAQRSELSKWNSGVKFVFSIACAFVCVAARSSYVPIFVFFAMSTLTLAVGKTPVRYYFSLMTVPVSFILLSVIAILFEIAPTPIGTLNFTLGSVYLCVTKTAQAEAAKIMFKAFGALSCLYMLSLATPIYRIFETLRKLRVPSVVIELMYLIYRYLFILLETHQNMTYSAASRLGYHSAFASIKTMMQSSLNLFFISLRKASGMFDSMEARCYDGQIRFLSDEEKLRVIELIVLSLITVVAVTIWIITGR